MLNRELLVLKSSAGSGKTYALVSEFLKLVLSSANPSHYRHLLALTFTNAAAAEMKNRVLSKLQAFASGPDHPEFSQTLADDLKNSVHIGDTELKSRSINAYANILHNYGQLQISTIDSFTHKLVRSFAHDLKLSYDFEVILDHTEFTKEVVDHCLQLVGSDAQLSDYLEKFVLQNLEEESNWNIRNQLFEFTQVLFQEKTIKSLRLLDGFSLSEFASVRETIKELRANFENKLIALAANAAVIMNSSGTTDSDFHTDLSSYFRKIKRLDLKLPGSRLQNALDSNKLHSSKASAEAKIMVTQKSGELTNILDQIVEQLSGSDRKTYNLCVLIQNGLFATGLLNTLHVIGHHLREQNNMLLISDFQQIINEVVRENPAPFVYERIGERFNHLLIDEFQDTSEMQWQNFIPLITNNLSNGHFNLLVGDAKQAIYRWRNGHVEQFINLPEIETNDKGSRQLFRNAYHEKNLAHNYRSATNIVNFNNKLFTRLRASLGEFEQAYHDVIQQSVRSNTGKVCIVKSSSSLKEERLENTLSHINTFITQCLQDGYQYNDMVVLTRRNEKEAAVVADYLVSLSIPVLTESSFLVSRSPAVQSLLYFIQHLVQPEIEHHKVLLASALNDLLQVENVKSNAYQEFAAGFGEAFRFDLTAFLKKYFPLFTIPTIRSESPMQLLTQLICRLNLKTDNYIESFLEKVFEQTSRHGLSISQLPEWWDTNKQKLFVAASGNENAVRIMTIHKSKGLQFPVVIYPRFISTSRNDKIWIEPTCDLIPLKAAYVQTRSVDNPELWPAEFVKEENQSNLDQLNLCYVACTRPEERLYIILETKKEEVESGDSELNAMIETTLVQEFPDNKTENGFEIGQSENFQTQKTNSYQTSIELLPEFELPPPTNAEAANREIADYKVEMRKRQFGKHIHNVLAGITKLNSENVEQAISRYRYELKKDDFDELQTQVISILNDSKFSKWFGENKIKSESEFVTAGGKVLRPDRIVYFDDRIEIIDFKTGVPRPSDHIQVKEYCQQLTSIETLPVIGYIAYTDSLTVMPAA